MKYFDIVTALIDQRPQHNLKHYENGTANSQYTTEAQRFGRMRKTLKRLVAVEYPDIQAYMNDPRNSEIVRQAFLDNGFYFGQDIVKGEIKEWCAVNLISVFEREKLERLRRVVFDIEYARCDMFDCEHKRTVEIPE